MSDFKQPLPKETRASRVTRNGLTVTTFAAIPPGLRIADIPAQELARYGLPPRPDREKSPLLYRKWQATFDRPITFIMPEFGVASTVRSQPPLRTAIEGPDSPNWSGVIAYPAPGESINGGVFGEWTVPNPKNVDGGDDCCSVWVGIDGTNLNGDLLQAGIETDVDGSGNQNCYAWWSWFNYSNPMFSVPVSNIPVVPGNSFETQIWVLSDSTANIYMFTGESNFKVVATLFGISAPAGVRLLGACAEWIVERPTLNTSGQLATLANYGTVEFSNAIACDASLLNTVFAGKGSTINMRDQNTGVLLSTGTIQSNEIIVCKYA
jgi:hypothetical protein